MTSAEPRFRLEIWSDQDQHGVSEWVGATFDTQLRCVQWSDTFDEWPDALSFGLVMLGDCYAEADQ